ncbi:LuxR C-terminal-related transcriptional regulator [Amycolatopsis sp. NPDC059090]|uniref:helix-turn-helix transcriptional regulator n=1 Tax=Amycolatopsis sp. NPDC059090 TaxID=3346723 RepID=UPI0036710D4C
MDKVRVTIRGLDALTVAGVAGQLDADAGIVVVERPRRDEVDVVVLAMDRFAAEQVELLRRTADELDRPIVLIANEVREVELVVAVECQTVAILSRASAAVEDRLAQCVHSAATDGAHLPPKLLAQLLEDTERLHREVLAPQGLSSSRLAPREVDVLRLMADGFDTAEIAVELSYSERTVKNIIYAITNRLNLRNRPQAVAYAMRAGVI